MDAFPPFFLKIGPFSNAHLEYTEGPWGDGKILYCDCGGDYTTVYIS